MRLTLLAKFSLISLVLFIVIGVLLGWGLTTHFEQQAIEQHKLEMADLVQPVVGDFLTPEVMSRGTMTESGEETEAYRAIENALTYIGGSGLVRIKIWNTEGLVVYSDQPDVVGKTFAISPELAQALEGNTTAHITEPNKEENVFERGYGELLEIYSPLTLPGETDISGAFEGYYDIDELRLTMDFTSSYLWTSIATGFLFLYVSLFTIVRNASQRLLRQSHENAMLLTDTERKATRLEMVNELARSVNESSLDLDAVFDTALRGIDRIVSHGGARITLLEESTGRPRTTYASSGDASPRLPDPDPNTQVKLQALGSAGTYICDDTRAGCDAFLPPLTERGVASLLLVGIVLGDRKLGLLEVESPLANAFDDDDAAIMKGVADQLAVAVENTRLIKETAENTALRETNRLKDEFVSMVSHELRTPLASIKGYARTLLSGGDHWDEQTRREFIEIISDESDKLSELVENLLEMSRIEAGRMPITPEPVLLQRFCKAVVDRLSPHHPHITFECDLPNDLPVVEADPRRVEQILTNLLQNAAKYSGGDRVDVLARYDGGGEVTVSVADNGVGIGPEHLPHIFRKFYRIESKSGSATAGTGLGLSIVQRLVEAQRGRVWVESQPGKGTTFHFTLPLLGPEEASDGLAPGRTETATPDKVPVA